jgi:hypothetical protein
VEIGFPEALLIVGVLLLVAASLSGLMHGTVLGENRDDSSAYRPAKGKPRYGGVFL